MIQFSDTQNNNGESLNWKQGETNDLEIISLV